ncbi:hypothetical protein [Pseudomonas typographi]|uniref:hypothetical protein n=1 Tax=Pseudomonas typographi TaxID=2715964 RepID=UPI0016846237|nr:hypothetical protein [Pseudomonas typographi]MBD1553609.1 hypothetical protein [Pseudomonas typographi]
MTDTTPLLPRKDLKPFERQFLKAAGELLVNEPAGGAHAMAALLDMVASWHAFRGRLGFEDYCKRWVTEGNCKNAAAQQHLRSMLGLEDDPTPRRAA